MIGFATRVGRIGLLLVKDIRIKPGGRLEEGMRPGETHVPTGVGQVLGHGDNG